MVPPPHPTPFFLAREKSGRLPTLPSTHLTSQTLNRMSFDPHHHHTYSPGFHLWR